MYLLVAIVVFLLGTDACVRSRAVVRLTCPKDQVKTADKRSTSAMVQWGREDFTVASTRPIKGIYQTVPVFGASVTVSKSYIEGTHYIEYKAVDDGGNFQSCSFTVTVKVVRCMRLHNPQFGLLNCDAEPTHLYGSKCTVSCIPGYSIVGPREVQCKRDGTWSHDIPFCRTTTCPDPGTPLHGTRLCTTATHAYGSICSFACNPGYQLVGESRLICRAERSWTDWSAATPRCQEITPPSLEKCPSNVQVTTSTMLTEVQRPAVVFRTGDGSTVRGTCTYFGEKEAHNFTLGTHHIFCKAFDPVFGEEAVSVCEFIIRVKSNPCRALVQPLNGVLLCSMAQGGGTALHDTTCKLFCNKGYAMARADGPSSSTFECDHTGTWQPTHRVPSCVRPKRPEELNLPSEMYYTSSNCTDSRDLSDVRIKFQSALQATIRGQNDCIMNPGNCLVEGVMTSCKVRHDSRWRRFAASRHRKHILASAGGGSDGVGRSAKRRRDAVSGRTPPQPRTGFVLPIQFHFATRIPEVGGRWPDEYHNAHSRLLAMFDYFERVVLHGAFTIRRKVTRMSIEEIKNSLTYAPVKAICESHLGYKFNSNILLCVPCGAGTQYNITTDQCVTCRPGYYQNEGAQLACKRCPPGTTSLEEGALNVTQCIEIDECESSPCLHGGRCLDGHNSYSCACLPGSTGRRCEEKIFDCSKHACQNGGSCVAHSQHNYSCQCPPEYTGIYCHRHTVDGGWSPWSAWSPCTKSCEAGTASRTRVCNSPQPINGGRACTGATMQMHVCNQHKCPECKRLRRPYQGFLHCDTYPDEDLVACTISCPPGFGFSAPVFPVYVCGKNTSYLWPHESPDNPRCVLPACARISEADQAMYEFKTSLPVPCPSKEMVAEVKRQIRRRAAELTKEVQCLSTGHCSLEEPLIRGCVPRSRRALDGHLEEEDRTDIEVALVYRGVIGAAYGEESSEFNNTVLELNELRTTLEEQTLSGSIYLVLGNKKIRIDPNATSTYNKLLCKPGTTQSPNGLFCVECSPGSFYDPWSGACSLCEVGTFQPWSAQSTCKTCPYGQTTYGRGAVISLECYEKGMQPPTIPENWEDFRHDDNINVGVAIPVALGVILTIAAVSCFIVIYLRKRYCKQYDIREKQRKPRKNHVPKSPEEVRLCSKTDRL